MEEEEEEGLLVCLCVCLCDWTQMFVTKIQSRLFIVDESCVNPSSPAWTTQFSPARSLQDNHEVGGAYESSLSPSPCTQSSRAIVVKREAHNPDKPCG